MGFMLSNIAQNAHSYGFRVSGLVSRDTLLKISFSEVWMQTSLSFQPLVSDLAINVHFFGVIGFLWIKTNS